MPTINMLNFLNVTPGTGNFSSVSNNGNSLLKVEQIFSGINYLEALSKINSIGELASTLSTDEANLSGGSLQSADADSIFNKFSIFKYSKFINGEAYQPQAHFIGYVAGTNPDPNDSTNAINVNSLYNLQSAADRGTSVKSYSQAGGNGPFSEADLNLSQNVESNLKLMDLQKRNAANYLIKNASTLANPTANNIITWAKTQSMESVTGFQPYAMSDFIFCKNYGKIPNNRLITLRRYPFPMDDLLRAPGDKNPIPIAQAVTWFGEGTDNVLSNIGVMNWGLRWDSQSLKVDDYQALEGNEVTLSELLNVFSGIPELKGLGEKIQTIYVGLYGNDAQLQQLSKQEQRLQDYSRSLYTSNGPYWNRIFGPVNVINATTRRARGMQDGWDQPFTISFHYMFRTFNGLSPKVVALDLIASFLNLTYNDAQFLGQLTRYFPKLGVKFSPTVTQMLGDLLTKWGTNFDGGSMVDLTNLMTEITTAVKAAGSKAVDIGDRLFHRDTSGLTDAAGKLLQAGTASLLADAIPRIISIKSALSDRPIGEWHLVVGNPMNPIMVMGDLICKNCILKFDEEMGPDDFPTGCTFTVKLAQGKPRDKASIERIFNLGQAKMMFSKMRNPSSASDTFGTVNNTAYSAIKTELTSDDKEIITNDLGAGSFERYRGRIRRSYGYKYYDGIGPTDPGAESTNLDDSMLWLYFDRGQDKT